MRVARLSVDGNLRFVDVDNDGPALHDALGGYMETIPLPEQLAERGLIGIVDEEGLLRELPYNLFSSVLGQPLVGPVIIVRSQPPEMVSLTDEDVEAIRQWLGDIVMIIYPN